MPRDYGQNDSGPPQQSMTIVILASLFLLLLTFFIVLSAYSSQNTSRARETISAVTQAFGFSGAGQTLIPGVGTDQGSGEMEHAAASGLRAVLPDLGFSSRTVGDSGSVMTVTIPKDELEDRWPALRVRLSELLRKHNPGERHRLQIMAMDSAESGPTLAYLASELVTEGVNPKMIAIGYEARGRDDIELRFVLGSGS